MSKKAEILKKTIIENGFDLTAQNTRFIISYQNMFFFEVKVSALKDSIIRYELSHAIHHYAYSFRKEDYVHFIRKAKSDITEDMAIRLSDEIRENLTQLDLACRNI